MQNRPPNSATPMSQAGQTRIRVYDEDRLSDRASGFGRQVHAIHDSRASSVAIVTFRLSRLSANCLARIG